MKHQLGSILESTQAKENWFLQNEAELNGLFGDYPNSKKISGQERLAFCLKMIVLVLCFIGFVFIVAMTLTSFEPPDLSGF